MRTLDYKTCKSRLECILETWEKLIISFMSISELKKEELSKKIREDDREIFIQAYENVRIDILESYIKSYLETLATYIYLLKNKTNCVEDEKGNIYLSSNKIKATYYA